MLGIVRVLVAALACSGLASPVVAAPAGDLKAVTSAELKGLKNYAKQRFAACSAEIGVVGDQVQLSLVTAPDGLEAVATAAGECIADVVSRAVDARTTVTEQGATILDAANAPGTLGFLVGDGSVIDQFMSKLNGELEKFRKQVDKRLRAYGAGVAKATNGYRQTVLVAPLRMDVAPQPNDPASSTNFDHLIYPSRLFLTVAGSGAVLPTDGKVCLSGRGFLTFGAPNLNVQLFGPTVASHLAIVPESGTGRWHTCFTNLPIGNYRVLVDQDPDQDATFAEASTEYATIGVP